MKKTINKFNSEDYYKATKLEFFTKYDDYYNMTDEENSPFNFNIKEIENIFNIFVTNYAK